MNRQGVFCIKMKKKFEHIRKIIVSIMCMILCLHIPVYAAEGTVFHVDNQTGKKGDTVTVPIEMHSGEDVGGFELTVYYDSDTLEFESLSKGDLIINDENEGLFDYNHKAENASVKIVYVVADTVKADGVIADIKFKLKKDCGKDLPIGMTVNEVVDNSDESNVVSGKVTGVDTDFQTEVENSEDIATENAEEASNTEETVTGQNGTETKENSKKGDSSKEAQEGKTKEQKAIKDNKKNVYRTVVAIGVIIIGGAIVIIIRKKKQEEN